MWVHLPPAAHAQLRWSPWPSVESSTAVDLCHSGSLLGRPARFGLSAFATGIKLIGALARLSGWRRKPGANVSLLARTHRSLALRDLVVDPVWAHALVIAAVGGVEVLVKRALIVIDVQNEYIDGNLPITFPDSTSSLAAIASAMDGAQACDVAVVVVQTLLADSSPIFAAGTRGAELHSVVLSRPRDLLISKPLPSCLAQTDLNQWLVERGITTLTLAGYMTHNCVDSTARHASHLGYNVEVLSDATGSLPYANAAGSATAEEIHRVSLAVLDARFAAVMTTARWLALLSSPISIAPTGIWSSYRNAVAS